MITIIDYKTGNLGSIQNMLKKLRFDSIITSDINLIEKAEKIILPGVGSFDHGMKMLSELGLLEVLNFKVLEQKIPALGICLGMQLMTNNSEEGTLKGLGWIDARTVRFQTADRPEIKIPHMGWNFISQVRECVLYKNMYENARFYFVHSYYVRNNCNDDVVTTTTYGEEFTSSFAKGNIFGAQFHPEKSHRYGMILLKNFAEL